MSWTCEDCDKSYSILIEKFYNSCRECVTIKNEKREREEYEYRNNKVKEYVSIFKEDTEKFYKTIAVLALINGIEYDATNNNAIKVRCNYFK